MVKHTDMPGAGSLLQLFPVPLPSPALPGSGSMGMISARIVGAPLSVGKGSRLYLLNQNHKLFILQQTITQALFCLLNFASDR